MIPVAMDFDAAVYRLSAVKKAAYQFADRFFIEIETRGPQIHVVLTPKDTASAVDAHVEEFRNAVLDQDLREIIAEETLGVRNLLLAQAFSAVSLIDPGSDADYREDPLGIQKSQGTGET